MDPFLRHGPGRSANSKDNDWEKRTPKLETPKYQAATGDLGENGWVEWGTSWENETLSYDVSVLLGEMGNHVFFFVEQIVNAELLFLSWFERHVHFLCDGSHCVTPGC